MVKKLASIFSKVRFPKNRGWRMALGAIALIALGGFGWWVWHAQTSTAVVASEVLQTTTVKRGNIKLAASGTATLNPRASATFGFRGSGQVVALNVAIGSKVTAGEVLASLNDASAKLALTQARRALQELTSPAAIGTAQQAVADAKVTLASARDTLAYYISPDVLYYEELVAKAQKDLQTALDAEAASPSEENAKKVQDAKTTLQIAQTGLLYAQSKYEVYLVHYFTFKEKQGRETIDVYSPPTSDQITAARAAYAVAVQNLADAQAYLTALLTGTIPAGATGSKITALEMAQEAVTAAQDTLNGLHLIAPIAGTITALNFALGDSVSSSGSITISDLGQPYIVDFYLNETDWKNVQVGYGAEVTFDILSDTVFTGKVVSVDPILTTQNGALYVHGKIQLDPINSTSLPSGTGGSVDVIGGQAQNAMLVPLAALHQYAPGQYAVFVMVNGKLTLRMVTVGLQDLVNAEVKSGLQQGDIVSTGIAQTK
jgi:multidrug efflux pump subunit AcrA (membrane-fusion protein)